MSNVFLGMLSELIVSSLRSMFSNVKDNFESQYCVYFFFLHVTFAESLRNFVCVLSLSDVPVD